jgi:hypothetical protein
MELFVPPNSPELSMWIDSSGEKNAPQAVGGIAVVVHNDPAYGWHPTVMTTPGGRLHGVVRSFARRGRGLHRCASSRGRRNQAPSGSWPDPRLFRHGRSGRSRPAGSAAGARRFQGYARTRCLGRNLPVKICIVLELDLRMLLGDGE